MSEYISIFDTYRNVEEKAHALEWTPISDFIALDPENYICEGNVQESIGDSPSEFMHYVLTKEMIIKCKMKSNETEPSLSQNSDQNYMMKLSMPFLTRYKTKGFYVIKLSICGSTRKFLFESKEEYDILFNGLKKICVIDNIENEYTFYEVLGCGGSSIVKLAKNNFTGNQYAIKCIRKQWFLEKPQSIVFFLET